jgi:Domain of unknown function (DUF4190)
MSEPTNPPQPPLPPPSQPPGAGYPAYPAYPAPPPLPYATQSPIATTPRNGLGMAALVIAIVGLLLCFTIVFGVLLGIAAVVMGFMGRGRVKRGDANNGGVALAGVVLGFLSIVAGLVFIPIYYYLFSQTGIGDFYDCMTKAGNNQAAQQQCATSWSQHLETKFSVTLTTAP